MVVAMSTRILILAVLFVLTPSMASASADRERRDCAPLWINNGKCRSEAWTCRHDRVAPLICSQMMIHARYTWCVTEYQDGELAKCQRAWRIRVGPPFVRNAR